MRRPPGSFDAPTTAIRGADRRSVADAGIVEQRDRPADPPGGRSGRRASPGPRAGPSFGSSSDCPAGRPATPSDRSLATRAVASIRDAFLALAVLYGVPGSIARDARDLRGGSTRCTISKRLVALGAASAILLAACSSCGASTAPSGRTRGRAVGGCVRGRPSSGGIGGASAAPSSGGQLRDYKACVAFDTGGLGDKGFNDLAKKGLEDAEALGYQTAFSEAQGATDYAANIQRLIDEGCQSIITVGFNQAQATIEATNANPDDRLRAGRRDVELAATTSPGTQTTPRPRPTSPAWTSRSTRPRCSPATSRPAFSKSGRSAPTAASSSRA